MIIDFHSHIRRNVEEKNYYTDELLDDMNKNNINIRVVSAMEGSSIEEQNLFISKFVSENSNILAGFAVINPKAENSIEYIEKAMKLPGIYGIEFNSLEHGYFPENCPNINNILEVIQKHDMPVKVFTGTGAMTMPQQWAIYAKKFPDIKFIMLHMGCFDFGYSCVDLAKEYENIYLETSNQYEVQIFNKAFKLLPPEKFLFGSQFYNKFTKCSIEQFDMFKLSDDFKEKLFYKNAKEILNL